MLEAGLALVIMALLIVSACGWGLWSLRPFRLQLPAPDRVLIAQALGWGAMTFPLLALGLTNLLYPAAFWVVVAIGLIGAFFERETLRQAILRARDWWRGNFSGFEKSTDKRATQLPLTIYLSLAALLFLASLPATLGPPSETDSLRAELAQAKVWIRHHGADFVPNYHWNQPPLAEFLYTLGLGIGPDSLPTLIHWWMGVLSAVAVFGLGRRVVSERAAALGALIYAATPTLAYSAASSKQDFFLSLYGWIALYGLLAWRRDSQAGWPALAGAMAGLGAATKLMGLYPYPILGIVLLWVVLDRGERDWRQYLRAGAMFAVAATLVVLPWWVRNYLVTGDPVWPAGVGLFADRFVTPDMARFLHNVKNDFGLGRSVWTFLLGPWHVTQNYARFSDPRTPTPPTFLLFLPALILGWRTRPAGERFSLAAMLVFCFGVYAFWWSQPQVPRYLYPLWAVASLAAGAGAAKMAEGDWPARLSVFAGMALPVALSFVVIAEFNRHFVPMLIGRESREAYLSRSVSYYADFRAVSALAPAGSRILVLEALSLYYLDDDYLMGLPPWEGVLDYDKYQNGVDLVTPLRELGITHILWIDKPGHVTDLVKELLRDGYLEEVYRNPEARRVGSRTLGQWEASQVILWRVNYPKESSH